jgi:hypothetical protein
LSGSGGGSLNERPTTAVTGAWTRALGSWKNDWLIEHRTSVREIGGLLPDERTATIRSLVATEHLYLSATPEVATKSDQVDRSHVGRGMRYWLFSHPGLGLQLPK